MSALLLRLAGPLQAWGDSSRFARRHTRSAPTKSGVLGLLAAAQGRRRTDPMEDLVGLQFGVRIDQPGRLQRDFQTAIRWSTGESMPLSYRYYLADAVFLAAVAGDRALLEGLDEASRNPTFPLFLGRRSCVPTLPISLGVVDGDVEEALTQAPWQASPWWRRASRSATVSLEVLVDADDLPPDDVVRDVPESWSPERREYGWRGVRYLPPIEVDNPDFRPRQGAGPLSSEPDFMAAVGGAPCL